MQYILVAEERNEFKKKIREEGREGRQEGGEEIRKFTNQQRVKIAEK